MLNQEQRLQDFKTNADQIEMKATSRNRVDAINMLKKGFCERFVANKCFMPIKDVQKLKERLI